MHSPTPWHIESGTEEIVTANHRFVAQVALDDGPQTAIDAAHIVKCVNAHDGLVEALKEAKEALLEPGDSWDNAERAYELAEAALAKAV